MGAETFYTVAQGKTAKEAFKAARDEARYEHGNGGYTGSIAEKLTFTEITLSATPEGTTRRKHAYAEADKLIAAQDRRIDDKWGPAGCYDLGGGEFLFFGWASS